MDNLFPDPAWNFVFGEALPRGRAGVYSLARYLRGETGAGRCLPGAVLMALADLRQGPIR